MKTGPLLGRGEIPARNLLHPIRIDVSKDYEDVDKTIDFRPVRDPEHLSASQG
jgi:hypothetical protein